MKCPIDDSELQMTERQSVEIDYCPKCRGVWLDRGELDKIIERSEKENGSSADYSSNQMPPPQYPQQGGGHGGYGYGKHGRRKGLLGELFDF